MLVFVRAAEDFELAVPVPGNFQNPIVAIPYADVNSTGPIGGQKKVPYTTRSSEMCVGEHFQSVKQLISRFNKVNTIASMQQPMAINPYFVNGVTADPTTGVLIGPTWGGDPFSAVGTCYASMRGGMKVAVGPTLFYSTISGTTFAPVPHWNVSLIHKNLLGSSNSVTTASTASIVATAWRNPGTVTAFNEGTAHVEDSTVYVRVPYYVPTPYSMISIQTSDIAQFDISSPYTYANIWTGAPIVGGFTLDRAADDDFTFSYFVSTPTVLFTYT